jgi:TPR repeat protein
MGTTLKLSFGSVVIAVFLAAASFAVAYPFEDGQAAYDRHDYATALQVWQPLADHGDAKAQNKIGNMYWAGQGVPKDYVQALSWYRLAADQGLAFAQFNLGLMYTRGQGVTQDYSEAVRWYEAAARQGNARAEYRLGLTYSQGQGVPEDGARAMQWFRLAADQGNADAQAKLSLFDAASSKPASNYSECVLETIKAQQAANEADREKFIREARGTPLDVLEEAAKMRPPPPSASEIERARSANFRQIKELCRIKYPCSGGEVPSNDYNTCLKR